MLTKKSVWVAAASCACAGDKCSRHVYAACRYRGALPADEQPSLSNRIMLRLGSVRAASAASCQLCSACAELAAVCMSPAAAAAACVNGRHTHVVFWPADIRLAYCMYVSGCVAAMACMCITTLLHFTQLPWAYMWRVCREQTPAGQLMWQYSAVQVLCCTASDAAAQCSDEGCMCIDMVSFHTHGCNLHGCCCGVGWSRGSYWHRFAVEWFNWNVCYVSTY